jgi:cyclophilin family peptidyl-prolyl cis-trans isomerase
MHPADFSLISPVRLAVVLGALAVGLTGCAPKSNAPATVAVPAVPTFAVVETDKGTFEFELLSADAPKGTENFRLLAARGYYNGLTFHRIIKGFMIQGGDPNGNGSGGESAWGGTFPDEIKADSPLYAKGMGYKRGIVAFANSGPNTNGSQFFVLHKDYPLPATYSIFGRVTKGIEVIDALAEVPVRRGADPIPSEPLTAPVIKKITIRQ